MRIKRRFEERDVELIVLIRVHAKVFYLFQRNGLFVCVYMCVCTSVHMCTRLIVLICVHAKVFHHISTHTQIGAFTYDDLRVTCIHIFMHVCVYVHTHREREREIGVFTSSDLPDTPTVQHLGVYSWGDMYEMRRSRPCLLPSYARDPPVRVRVCMILCMCACTGVHMCVSGGRGILCACVFVDIYIYIYIYIYDIISCAHIHEVPKCTYPHTKVLPSYTHAHA